MHKTEASGLTLDQARQSEGSFTDYKQFEGSTAERALQMREFIGGEIWSPHYDYPALDHFIDTLPDGTTIAEMKHRTQLSIQRLEEAVKAGEVSEAEAELFARSHERRLVSIMMIEAAVHLHEDMSSGAAESNRRSFGELNERLFGEFDAKEYRNLIGEEADEAIAFTPETVRASDIKRQLQRFYANKPRATSNEYERNPQELLGKLKEVLLERYGHILSVVPETDDTVYYEASDCQRIMTDALEAGGLAQKGWRVEVSEKRTIPSTDAEERVIRLPSSIRRNAHELKKLILHEQEVHARRGENGRETNVSILGKGTADYADVEEGLGVLFECALDGNFDNPSFHRARDRYLAVGLALGEMEVPRDSRQVYEILWRMIALRNGSDGDINHEIEMKAKKLATAHVENIFRGTNFAMPGVIYRKAKVYYEGLMKNVDHFLASEDINEAIDEAMIAKINHTDKQEVGLVKKIIND